MMNLKKNNTGGLKFCGVLLMGSLLCAALNAQNVKQPMRLNPDEAVKLAVENNLGLKSSQTSLSTKKRASDLSWNQFIPSVTLAGSVIRDNEKSTVSGLYPVDLAPMLNPIYEGINSLPFSTAQIPLLPAGSLYGVTPYSVDAPQWHIAGSIQASLNISVAMFENMKRLRLDYEGGLLSYDKARAQLERDIRKAYHNILLVQENVSLLRGSFENAERQVQMAQTNYRVGLAPELTLLQAQVARENLRPVIDQAENGLRLSMAQFAMYLGLDYNTVFELIPVEDNIGFIPVDITDMISRAAARKPDILELKQNILLLQSARKAQVGALFPSLSLSWTGSSAFIRDPWKDSWFDSKDDWRKSGSLTIALGLRLHSLIPFSADFQGIKNLDDQIRIANIGLSQMIQGTEIEVYNIVLSLEKTRINTEALQKNVEMAERSYRLTEQAYQAGLQDLFQVQNAEQSLRQARVQMLEQHFNYTNGLIDLEYAIGVPFGTLSTRGVIQ
jgi:outer membrane protein TolC